MKCDDFPLRAMAWLDDEIGRDDRKEFEEHVAGCDRCRTELEKLRRVKEMTTRVRLADLQDRDWARFWTVIYNRLERAVGWTLLSLGAIVVLSYGAYTAMKEALTDPAVPVLVRAGTGAIVLGLIVLFVSVARQRLRSWKRDPYREVER